MTFNDWYFHHATAEERQECAEVGARTEGMELDRKVRERTLYKLQKLCHGHGLTIEADHSKHILRWRVVEAAEDCEMQFETAEVALEFCREEPATVANWLRTIIANWLVMPDGKAVLI